MVEAKGLAPTSHQGGRGRVDRYVEHELGTFSGSKDGNLSNQKRRVLPVFRWNDSSGSRRVSVGVFMVGQLLEEMLSPIRQVWSFTIVTDDRNFLISKIDF